MLRRLVLLLLRLRRLLVLLVLLRRLLVVVVLLLRRLLVLLLVLRWLLVLRRLLLRRLLRRQQQQPPHAPSSPPPHAQVCYLIESSAGHDTGGHEPGTPHIASGWQPEVESAFAAREPERRSPRWNRCPRDEAAWADAPLPIPWPPSSHSRAARSPCPPCRLRSRPIARSSCGSTCS